MIRVPIDLDSPDAVLDADAFGAGALIRVERADAEVGVYAEITTVEVVAETYHYDYFDATGGTDSWYRWRVSNAANTAQSGYSAAYQGVDLASDVTANAYATLADLLVRTDQRVDELETLDTRILARWSSILVEATREINGEIGHDYFRHPAAGTEVRVWDGSGTDRLCLHDGTPGIVPDSLTLVEVSLSRSNPSWEALAAADWELMPRHPEPGYPHDHLELTGAGSYSRWPRLVRTTAVYGAERPPADARAAVLDRARQVINADPSASGGIVGNTEYGRMVATTRMPDRAWRFIRRELERDWCDV